jgi:hypothetical protein
MPRRAWVEPQLDHERHGASVAGPRRIADRAMVLWCHGRDNPGMLPHDLPRVLRIAPPRGELQSMQRRGKRQHRVQRVPLLELRRDVER